MDCPAQTTSPSIPQILKVIRQRDSRSAHIHRQVAALGAPGESNYDWNVYYMIQRYCHPSNQGLALVCFNLHRIPFNPIPPGQLGERKWGNTFWPSTLGIRENLQEFIELMDNVNQLVTAFAGVPDPERHWRVMRRRALHRIFWFNDAEDIGRDIVQTRGFMSAISLAFQTSANRNPPGSPPVDITGNPINSDFFALVQREFLLWEFKTRADRIQYLYRSGYLPKNKEVQKLFRLGCGMPPEVDIQPFKQLVKRQRLIITAQKATIDQDEEKLDFPLIVNDGDFFALGVQGLAASLPKQGDQYEKRFLYLLNFVNYQLETDLVNYGSRSREAWCDGWFGKYSDVGPSAHVFLDDDYLIADGEYPSWLELFVGKKREPVAIARECGLLTAAERVRLWGPAVDAFSCDVLWETFVWLGDWIPSADICDLWDTTMITPRSLLVEEQCRGSFSGGRRLMD